MGKHEVAQQTVPGPSPEMEAQRRKELRKHKAIATGLLIFAAAVYFLCRFVETVRVKLQRG